MQIELKQSTAMKRQLTYLLLALTAGIIVTGCSKYGSGPGVATPVDQLPDGTFSGTLTQVHINTHTGATDTIRATTVLQLTQATHRYNVGGDTSKIQANCYGTYIADGVNISFVDSTLSFNSVPNINLKKKHLFGTYQYQYIGMKTLEIYTQSADTLQILYILNKI